MNEINFIAKTMEEIYDGAAWHGPNIKSVLAKIQPAQANKRIGNGHSIIELVLHMHSWRRFVIEKLEGNNAYDVSDQDNFPNEQIGLGP